MNKSQPDVDVYFRHLEDLTECPQEPCPCREKPEPQEAKLPDGIWPEDR